MVIPQSRMETSIISRGGGETDDPHASNLGNTKRRFELLQSAHSSLATVGGDATPVTAL